MPYLQAKLRNLLERDRPSIGDPGHLPQYTPEVASFHLAKVLGDLGDNGILNQICHHCWCHSYDSHVSSCSYHLLLLPAFNSIAEFGLVFDGRGHHGELVGFVVVYVKEWRLQVRAVWVSHSAKSVTHETLAAMFVEIVQVLALMPVCCHECLFVAPIRASVVPRCGCRHTLADDNEGVGSQEAFGSPP